MTPAPERILIALGALAGGIGVALAAASAHVAAGATLETSSRFLLVHAPALIGLAAVLRIELVHRRIACMAGAALSAGCLLFSGELAWRALIGPSPAPLAAPIGGILLLAGWALLLAAALSAPSFRRVSSVGLPSGQA